MLSSPRNPLRILWIILFFCILMMPNCKSGKSPILPIIPTSPGNVEEETKDSPNTIIIGPGNNLARGGYTAGTGYHSQVSPLMPVEVYDEIDLAVNLALGTSPLPEDELMFLFASPSTLAETNPPLIKFAFLSHKDSISPDEIDVILDAVNISDSIQYCVNYNHERDANYYIGAYVPSGYLDPTIQHQLDITLAPPGGDILDEQRIFNVPTDEQLVTNDAFFLMDEIQQIPDFTKLLVFVGIP